MKRMVLIIGMVLLGTPTVLAQNGHDLFQKALQKERAEGNLEAAIALYERIVEEHASDRALVAKALLQMGQDYERLGRAEEAQRVFATVANEYADQVETAQLAQAKVTAMRSERVETVEDEAGIVTREVRSGGYEAYIEGSPSPDGRYLSYSDSGDVALLDPTTGTIRALTHEAGMRTGRSLAAVIHSVFSPDSRRIAYAWQDEEGGLGLRIVGIDGSTPRVVYQHPDVVYPRPRAWFPDGKTLLATFYREDQTKQFVRVDVADGSTHVLKTLGHLDSKGVGVSPDGRYVAYDLPPDEDTQPRDIFILDADDGREWRVVEHPANDQMLGWTPDGQWLLFRSDRAGTDGVWAIRIADGQADGAPRLIKAGIGDARPLGFTQEGAFYYAYNTWVRDIQIAQIDPATGQFLAPPHPLPQQSMGYKVTPAWSPDGEHLAYVLDEKIILWSPETGEERELSTSLDELGGGIRWAPSQSMLVLGREGSQEGLFLIDAQTGDLLTKHGAPVLPRWREDGSFARWAVGSPDETAIYYTDINMREKISRLMKRDLDTGQEQELFRSDDIFLVALSPDGKHLAFNSGKSEMYTKMGMNTQTLMVIPTDGGEPRELLRLEPTETEDPRISGIAWSPDGAYILIRTAYYSGPSQLNKPTELWRIPFEGGAPEVFDHKLDGRGPIDMQPNGQYLAFETLHITREIWVMENIMEKLQDEE